MNIATKLSNKLKRDGLLPTAVAILRYPATMRRKIIYQNMLRKSTLDDRFSEIYKKNIWKSNESFSGEGSEVEYTESLRKWLVDIIPKLDIKTFVDAPCGDFNWMKLVLPKVDIDYYGYDIVEKVIEQNNEKYASEKVKFEVANICKDPLPKCDVLMIRDCLFHLSYDDINQVLHNISHVDYRYLLTTTHSVENKFMNKDITSGTFRMIDLFSAPFNFDENTVVDRVNDYPKRYPKPRYMILVEKENVPITLSDSV